MKREKKDYILCCCCCCFCIILLSLKTWKSNIFYKVSSLAALVSKTELTSISEYPSRTKTAAAIMHVIMNNLDPRVAQFPEELVTYGGNGQVFSNWVQV